MRPWDVLLVCILFSSIVGYGLAQAETGRDFLDYKEEQVQRIAEQASANDDKKCELVQSCSDPTECTRGGCSPLKNDSLKCTTIMENKQCLEDYTCTSILVNFERSYVRYPRYDYDESDDSDSVSTEMRDSICSQRRLDPLFRELLDEQQKRNENSSEDYYFNFYFGSVDGTFRFYPGLEVKDCFGFDPRILPWYLGAISVKKDMIVLLDTGASMANDKVGLTISTTSGQVANILTQHLLTTLTGNDTAKVITFDSIQTSRLLDITVPSRGFHTYDFENLWLPLKYGIRDYPPSGPSNYTAALMEAISTLSVSSSDNLKIIILLTDGKSTVPSEDQLAAVVTEIEAQSMKLFIYEISDLAPSLSKIACSSTQGYHERLDHLRVLQNPLYWVNSYFTMLARSNIQAGGPTLQPFWQREYTDYGNLGSTITVAFPVMSPDGRRLIGVAGIDIQISGLPATLKSQIEESLRLRRNNITVNKQGVAFDNCTAVSGVDGCSSSSDQRPICDKDDLKSSYEDLLCCGECSIDEDPNSQSVVILAVLCVGAALGVVVVVVVYLRICKPRTILPPIVDIVKVPKFSYLELYLATNRFSDLNKLGEGTFGVVYRGNFANGKEVAVKKLHYKPDHDKKNLEAEIRILATANHNNLLALKGFCVDQSYMLVCELLENGDLDDWLFEKPLKGQVLSWSQRVIIAKGTAKGLAYLHEELQNEQEVCHSDIKPANILLDKDFNPKVADFGMAKLYDRGTEVYPDGGTIGYMAPEVLNGALADTKSDVYSYGMVLLEMVTGCKFSDFKTESLRHWANKEVTEGRERELVDPLLQNLTEDDHTTARTLLSIALWCTMLNPDARPDMSAVVQVIEGFFPVPLPFTEEQAQKLSPTRGLSGESFIWEGTWTLSQVLGRFKRKAKDKGEKKRVVHSAPKPLNVKPFSV